MTNPSVTLRHILSQCQPGKFLPWLRQLRDSNSRGFANIIAGTYRRNATIIQASSATQVHPYPASIDMVQADGGGPLAILCQTDDTAGAGEVLIVYDAEGVPTLTFGDGALTTYHVIESAAPLPTNVLSRLDTPEVQLEVT